MQPPHAVQREEVTGGGGEAGRQAGEEVTPEGQDKLKTADQVWSHAGNPHFSIPYLATGLLLLNANLIMLQKSS